MIYAVAALVGVILGIAVVVFGIPRFVDWIWRGE